MPVLVALARRDDRDARSNGVEQPRRGRRGGAVVPDLEKVDRRKQAAIQQRRLDRRLGVTGEQRAEAAVAEHHHH